MLRPFLLCARPIETDPVEAYIADLTLLRVLHLSNITTCGTPHAWDSNEYTCVACTTCIGKQCVIIPNMNIMNNWVSNTHTHYRKKKKIEKKEI